MNATHDYMNTNLALDDDDDDDENEDALRSFVETLTLDADRRNKNTTIDALKKNAPSDTFSLPPSLDHYLDQLLRNSSSDEDEENASMYEMRDAFASCVEEPQKQRKKKRLKTCLELIMNEEEQYLPSSEEAQLNLTTLMHDEKQEGILRFMTRDKDMDAWGMCMSDAREKNAKRKSSFNFEDDDDDNDDDVLVPSGIFFSSDVAIISANIPDQTNFPSREDAWQSEKTPEVTVEEIKKKRLSHAVPKSNRRAKPQNPSRSSQMRGVTKHRLTGRYEAHLWDSSSSRVTPKPGGRTRGRQIYLGGYLTEIEAAKSYDKAAIKLWGTNANLNLNYETYAEDIEVMKSYDFADYVKALRRESSGFTRGVSKYRGVTKHVKSATNKHGKTFTKQIWEARLGRVKGSKYAYLGTFDSEIEAARGYDLASLKFRGDKAVTNFDKSNYSETEIETYKFPHRAAICDDTNDNDDDGDDNEGTKKIKNKNENKKDKAKWKP